MNKSIIIYFSRADENYSVGYIEKGNTQILAEFIKDLTNADIFKVEPLVPYAKDYETCIKEAQERMDKYEAPVVKEIPDISEYDLVYIGTPVYWSYMPEELALALKKCNWNNKKIKLFVTHEGSGLAGIPKQLNNICNGATIEDTIAIRGFEAKDSLEKIKNWI